jgi:hypothetical protein
MTIGLCCVAAVAAMTAAPLFVGASHSSTVPRQRYVMTSKKDIPDPELSKSDATLSG